MLEDENLRQMPFKVPDGYFDTLPLQIEELRLKHSKKSPLPIRRVLTYAAGTGVAAAVTLLLFLTINFNGTNKSNNYFTNDFRRASIKIKSPHAETINRINNIFKTASINVNEGNRLYKEDLQEAMIEYLASENYYLDNAALYADF